MTFAVLNYFTDADWRLFLFISGSISLIGSCLLTTIIIRTNHNDIISSVKLKANDIEEEEEEMDF